MIEWKDAWNVGVPLIDSEHKKLVDLLRQIEIDANNSSVYLRATILSLSSEVTNHMTSHFAHEEKAGFRIFIRKRL